MAEHEESFNIFRSIGICTAVVVLIPTVKFLIRWYRRRVDKQRERLMEDKLKQLLTHDRARLTSSPDYPDMITLDNSPERVRVIMSCGHVISPESMVNICWDTLSKGQFILVCPDPTCDVEWDYAIVRHVASVFASVSRLKEFDKLVSENYLQKNTEIQKCPNCMTWCCRVDSSKKCAECPVCKLTSGLEFKFCWDCLWKWKSELKEEYCGNPNCIGTEKRIAFLANCPDKLILGRSSPAVRGCPKCGVLIEYLDGCSQMNCRACKHHFCFYCLKGANTKQELTCDPFKSQCQIAARQTILPGM